MGLFSGREGRVGKGKREERRGEERRGEERRGEKKREGKEWKGKGREGKRREEKGRLSMKQFFLFSEWVGSMTRATCTISSWNFYELGAFFGCSDKDVTKSRCRETERKRQRLCFLD